jgi:hypothetical protein
VIINGSGTYALTGNLSTADLSVSQGTLNLAAQATIQGRLEVGGTLRIPANGQVQVNGSPSPNTKILATGTIEGAALSSSLSAGGITEDSGGKITGSLSLSSSAGISLPGPNGLSFAAFNNSGTGNVVVDNAAASLTLSPSGNPAGTIAVTNSGTLIVGGAISAGGNISLSGGTLHVNEALTATGNISLLSGSAVSQVAAGILSGTSLTVRAAGAISLDTAANRIGAALDLVNSSVTAGDIRFKNDGPTSPAVTVKAENRFTSGLVEIEDPKGLTVETSSGINAPGNRVFLRAQNGAVTQSGPLTAGTLWVEALDPVTLNTAVDAAAVAVKSGGAVTLGLHPDTARLAVESGGALTVTKGSGPLQITTLEGLSGLKALAGGISLAVHDDLTQDQPLIASGELTLGDALSGGPAGARYLLTNPLNSAASLVSGSDPPQSINYAGVSPAIIGPLTTLGGDLTVSAAAILLRGDLKVQGVQSPANAVTLNGSLSFAPAAPGALVIDNSGDGNITLNGQVDDTAPMAHDLTLRTGPGTLTLNGALGALQPLKDLRVELGNGRWVSPHPVTARTIRQVNLPPGSPGSSLLAGSLVARGDEGGISVEFHGPVTLSGDLRVESPLTLGLVHFQGALGEDSGPGRSFTFKGHSLTLEQNLVLGGGVRIEQRGRFTLAGGVELQAGGAFIQEDPGPLPATAVNETGGPSPVRVLSGGDLTLTQPLILGAAAALSSGGSLRIGDAEDGSGSTHPLELAAGTLTCLGQVEVKKLTLRGNLLNHGRIIAGTGDAEVAVEFQGDYDDGGTGSLEENPSGSWLLFSGIADQTARITQSLALGKLRIDKSGGKLSLGADLRLKDGADLEILQGTVDTGGYALSLGSGAPPAAAFGGLSGKLRLGSSGAELLIRGDLFLGGTFEADPAPGFAPPPLNPSPALTRLPRLRVLNGSAEVGGSARIHENLYLVMEASAGGTRTFKVTGPGQTIGSLALVGTGTLKMETDLALRGSVSIGAGAVLDAGTGGRRITVGGSWSNGGTFSPGDSEAIFTGPEAYLEGSTVWYSFECTRPGARLRFSVHPDTHQIKSLFRIKSSDAARPLILTKIPDPPPAPTGIDHYESEKDKYWTFDLDYGAKLDFQNIDIFYCYSTRRLPIPLSVNADPYYQTPGVSYFNINWVRLFQFFYSYTEDSDSNGRIDRLRLQSGFELLSGEGAFADFEIAVDGYEIDRSRGFRGYERVGNGLNRADSIYVYLKEQPYSDGGAVLSWEILNNGSLKEQAAEGAAIGRAGDRGTTTDTVPPRINYTLALPAHNEIFLQFSEALEPGVLEVWQGGVPLTIESVAPGEHPGEFLIRVAGSLGLQDLAEGKIRIVVSGTFDRGERARDHNEDYPLELQYPSPAYPTDWTYGVYQSAVLAQSPPGALIPKNGLIDSQSPANPAPSSVFHRGSDVLISSSPSGAEAVDYFIWPLWAKDNDTTPAPEAEFRPAAFGEFGLVRDFTGRDFLQYRDRIVLQAWLHRDLGGRPELFYATVPEDFRADGLHHGPEGLWLPPFDRRDYSNIVPRPVPESGRAEAEDRGGRAFTFTLFRESGGRNNYENRKTLDFFFRLGTLYAARLSPSPADQPWYRRVKPFSIAIRNITQQRSGVTILNNVIDPGRNEKTYLDLRLTQGGRVTIQVFTLDGNLVRALRRESLPAGEYRESWDGKNQGGRPVARGMYLIRVVAPDIDEIRKVLVIRN